MTLTAGEEGGGCCAGCRDSISHSGDASDDASDDGDDEERDVPPSSRQWSWPVTPRLLVTPPLLLPPRPRSSSVLIG
jgi:hypothetical protein